MGRVYERLFAIEGGDGAGKGTQTKALTGYLEQQGHDVLTMSFPRYGNPTASTVEMYLRGEFGPANSVAPELASAAFLLDRIGAAPDIANFFETHPEGIGVFDRYVASNAAHQAAKIPKLGDRIRFYQHTLEQEYEAFSLPKPKRSIVLLVPTDIAQSNVDSKGDRSYTTAKRDVHEADADHLNNTLRNYQELCELFPDEFTAIWAVDRTIHKMRPIDDIQAEIREVIGV